MKLNLNLKKLKQSAVTANPLLLIAGAVIIAAGSFYAGDAFSNTISLPGLNSVSKLDYSSLGPALSAYEKQI